MYLLTKAVLHLRKHLVKGRLFRYALVDWSVTHATHILHSLLLFPLVHLGLDSTINAADRSYFRLALTTSQREPSDVTALSSNSCFILLTLSISSAVALFLTMALRLTNRGLRASTPAAARAFAAAGDPGAVKIELKNCYKTHSEYFCDKNLLQLQTIASSPARAVQ